MIVESDSGRTIARLQHDVEVVDVTRLDAQHGRDDRRERCRSDLGLAHEHARPERTPMIPQRRRLGPILGGPDQCLPVWLGWRACGPPSDEPSSRRGSAPTPTACRWIFPTTGFLPRPPTLTEPCASGQPLALPFTPRLPHAAAVPLVGFLPESRQLLTVDSDWCDSHLGAGPRSALGPDSKQRLYVGK